MNIYTLQELLQQSNFDHVQNPDGTLSTRIQMNGKGLIGGGIVKDAVGELHALLSVHQSLDRRTPKQVDEADRGLAPKEIPGHSVMITMNDLDTIDAFIEGFTQLKEQLIEARGKE